MSGIWATKSILGWRVSPRSRCRVDAMISGGPDWYQPPDHVDRRNWKDVGAEPSEIPETQRVAWLQTHVWPYEARMLAAVADGVRSADPGARFSTHVSGVLAVRPTEAIAFFTAMKDGGYLPDELGFSFYPTSTAEPARSAGSF